MMSMSDKTCSPEPDTPNSGVSIGDVAGGIHDTIMAGRDVYITVDTAVRDAQFRRNHRQMLEKVRLTWIKGLLEPSLYHLVRLELGLETRPDEVERPFDLLVQRPAQ